MTVGATRQTDQNYIWLKPGGSPLQLDIRGIFVILLP